MSSGKTFQGSLETMPLSNILQWLADSGKTGTLTVTVSDEKKYIALKDGIVVSAGSNLEKERFGNTLVKRGFVTQKQVEALLEEGKKSGKLLGKLCVEKGLVKEEDVKSMLQEQSVAIIENLLHREEGRFVFLDETIDESEQIPLSIALQELFFGSAGKRKQWRRIYDLLGSLESVPIASGIHAEKVYSLSEFQQKLISRCDGKRRILDIMADVDDKDFAICQALADLTEKKIIEIKDPSEKTQRDYQDRIWQVHIAMEQNRFFRANVLLDDITAMFPERFDDLRPLQEKAMKLLQENMKNVLADESVMLFKKPGFDQASVSGRTFGPQEWFIYSRIVEKIKLKDLIRMTGLPQESSRRAIYALIDAGAIEIEGKKPVETDSGETKPSGSQKIYTKPARKKTQTRNTQSAQIANEKSTPPDVSDLEKTYRKYLKMNHYQILNVTKDSTQEEIRNAFVKLSRLYHPDMYDRDKIGTESEDRMEELFSMVNHAYRVISNVKSRERYDKNLWVEGRFSHDIQNDLEDRVSRIDKIVVKSRQNKSDQINNSGETRHANKKTVDGVKSSSTGKVESDDMKSKSTPPKPEKRKSHKEEDLLLEAKELFKNNKYREAIEKLESVLKKNSRNADAYYYLSRCQQRMGGDRLKDALDNIKRALILNKENATYFCQIGRVCISLKMFEDAERFLKTALAWNYENPEAKYLLEKLKDAQQTGFFAKFKKKKPE
jgi:curved DNA-binding protein CbpA